MASRSEVDQRRSEIARIVTARGFVRVDELADRFKVTSMTIHRDLDDLDSRGVLTKVRSGARSTPLEERERNVMFREHHMVAPKEAIASAAIDWLDEQSDIRVVALDDSTTALAMVPALLERPELTLVTNFHPAIDRISRVASSKLIAIGGSYEHEFQSFHGFGAIEAIRSLQIDVTFMSATAVGAQAVFHPSETALLTKRALLTQSDIGVLLVDHTKFTRRALHRQAKLSEFGAAVTDSGTEQEDIDRLRERIDTVIVGEIPSR